jgi:hypothetical protein
MRLWFAIPFGAAMLRWPLVAEWFVLSCLVLAVIFGSIAAVRVIGGGQ